MGWNHQPELLSLLLSRFWGRGRFQIQLPEFSSDKFNIWKTCTVNIASNMLLPLEIGAELIEFYKHLPSPHKENLAKHTDFVGWGHVFLVRRPEGGVVARGIGPMELEIHGPKLQIFQKRVSTFPGNDHIYPPPKKGTFQSMTKWFFPAFPFLWHMFQRFPGGLFLGMLQVPRTVSTFEHNDPIIYCISWEAIIGIPKAQS